MKLFGSFRQKVEDLDLLWDCACVFEGSQIVRCYSPLARELAQFYYLGRMWVISSVAWSWRGSLWGRGSLVFLLKFFWIHGLGKLLLCYETLWCLRSIYKIQIQQMQNIAILPQRGTFIFHMFSTLPSWAQNLLLASVNQPIKLTVTDFQHFCNCHWAILLK